MSRLDQIIQTVSANGMREITVERAKQIAIEYAKEVAQASLEKASENVTIYESFSEININHWVNKESITNPENIVIL